MTRVNQPDSLQQTAEQLGRRLGVAPRLGVVLGSGLSTVADGLAEPRRIRCSEVNGWAESTADGHRGEIIAGTIAGTPAVMINGRLHRYEGHSQCAVARPIEMLARLGVQTLVVTNAAGAVNPQYRKGEIVVIHDHIDLMHGAQRLRFCSTARRTACPDTAGVPLRRGNLYSPVLCKLALHTARRDDFVAHPGTYLATLGPNYETRAEYRMMRRIGADVVGMSTVPETLAAQRHGMEVLALSVISNIACPDAPAVANHEEVLDVGGQCAPRIASIVQAVAEQML